MTHRTHRLALAWLPVGLLIVYEAALQLLHLYPLSLQLGQATVPWLMARHRVLYETILEHRPPLTAWIVYAVQPLFRGDTIVTVQALHLLALAATTALVFVAARRLALPQAGLLAAAYFAVLEPVFDPVAFYFETVQGLLYAGLLVLLLKPAAARWELFGAGVLLGLAFFTKQQAVLVIGWVLLWLWWRDRRWLPVATCAAGVALPFAAIWGGYALSGHWDAYYYWNVTFNAHFGSDFLLPSGDYLRRLILTQGWLLPCALLALRARDKTLWLVVGLGLAAQATEYPRSSEMHAGAALPVVSVAFGATIAALRPTAVRWREWSPETLAACGVVGMVIVAVATNVLTGFAPSAAGFRAVLGDTEFRDVTAWLDAHAAPGDTLYVLPSGDSTAQLHPLTGLEPPRTWATGNQYVHGPRFVTERLLSEWAEQPPTWLIWFPAMTDEIVASAYYQPLLDFMLAHYDEVARFEGLPFYGDASVWRYRDSA